MRLIKRFYHILFIANINSVKMVYFALYLYQKKRSFLSILIKNKLISKYGIHLGLKCRIGRNLKLPHPQGIIIGEGSNIGDNCTIYHNVTLGAKHGGNDSHLTYPTIGNNVTIYTGAVILGNVSISDNSIIGANSLVVSDVEPNTMYAGSPAKKIKDI